MFFINKAAQDLVFIFDVVIKLMIISTYTVQYVFLYICIHEATQHSTTLKRRRRIKHSQAPFNCKGSFLEKMIRAGSGMVVTN